MHILDWLAIMVLLGGCSALIAAPVSQYSGMVYHWHALPDPAHPGFGMLSVYLVGVWFDTRARAGWTTPPSLKCRLFRQSALECGQWERQRLPLPCSMFRIGTGCGRAEARPYHKKPTPERTPPWRLPQPSVCSPVSSRSFARCSGGEHVRARSAPCNRVGMCGYSASRP
jgi:hypothetical protein